MPSERKLERWMVEFTTCGTHGLNRDDRIRLTKEWAEESELTLLQWLHAKVAAAIEAALEEREPDAMTYATRWDLLLDDPDGLTIRRFDPEKKAVVPIWIGYPPPPTPEREAVERWVSALAEAVIYGGLSSSLEAQVLAEVNGYDGRPDIFEGVAAFYEETKAVITRAILASQEVGDG